MSIDIMKIIESKLNSLPKQSPKRNPLEHQRPPGFPPVGIYAPYKPMGTYQTAVQIHAFVKNSLFNKTWPIEKVWQRTYSVVINQIIHYADKCWRICSTSEAEDIVKTICEKAEFAIPPKFENTPNDNKDMSNSTTNNVQLKRLELTSASGSELNLEALYRIMPSAFTEVRDDKTGEISHKINFNTLRELLGDNAYDGADEEYGFKWVGKSAARREAARPINKTLRPYPEESVDWENTQNLYIEGDNLEVLKLLQKSYLGKVKMIYIDPPYNTGNDFVYRDDFALRTEEYNLQAGNIDELGVRYRKNTESEAKGRFHSNWCSMIYERLLVARSLLTDDGAIFISIGVEEIQNLKAICNEVFGENNFVEIFSWVKTSTPPSLATKSRKTNEYIVCYEKNKSKNQYNGEALDGGDQPLLNTGNARSILTFPKEKVYFKENIFPNGNYRPYSSDKVSLLDTIEIVDGYATSDFRLEGEFKWTQDFFNQEVANGTTFIIKSELLSVRFIRTGEGYKRPTNFIKEKYTSPTIDKPNNNVGTNENASSDLSELMDNMEVFSYPKPVSLIEYLSNFVCKDTDIVLDFFSGSSTTAEAVLLHNREFQKKLKYIMVQLAENLDENIKTADANTRVIIQNGINFLNKYNKPHLLTELAKERIRRAGKKIKNEGGPVAQKLDIGFRVFKCEDSFMNNVYFSPNDLSQADLFSQVSNIKEGTSDLSLLFGCMLDWGVQLSLPLSSFEVSGKTIYNVNDGDLVACFAEDVNEEVISAIAELMPLRVVFRDSCFSDAPLKMNLFELFKQKCGWSEEVIKNRVHVI